jgi:hypothetical protein
MMIQKFLDFFLKIPIDTWRDVVLSSFFIPLVFYLATKLRIWIVSLFPLNILFAGYRKTKTDILIFLSQLSGSNTQSQLVQNQIYISRFPQPLPTNQNNIAALTYRNIDPVWSQSDGQCAAEVFNILGQINKHQGFRIADTIRDWNERINPIFTIGFNPKTRDLLNCCTPINFQLLDSDTNLSIEGQAMPLGARYPDDAGILQKTFVTNTDIPVFILAGLGTAGTEVAGKVLNQNCIALGKLYGNKPFCVLFKTDIIRRSSYYEIKGIFPKPKLYRALWYPITFFKWYRKKVYPN